MYIKRYRSLVIFIALFALNGCSSLKLQPEQVALTTSEQGQILQLIPNPYLTQKQDVSQAAKLQFEVALTAMGNKNWVAAEQQLAAMTATYPKLSGPYVNLGITLWHQDKLEEASTAFNQAIDVNSLNGDAYVQFALMLREQGQFNDAEALYQHAIKIWPHNQQAHINLGILYDLYMGQFAKAVEHYEMAQRLQSEPDKKLAGWILDTKRRVPKVPDPEPEAPPQAEQPTETQAEAK